MQGTPHSWRNPAIIVDLVSATRPGSGTSSIFSGVSFFITGGNHGDDRWFRKRKVQNACGEEQRGGHGSYSFTPLADNLPSHDVFPHRANVGPQGETLVNSKGTIGER
jgi:hypothetical protein